LLSAGLAQVATLFRCCPGHWSGAPVSYPWKDRRSSCGCHYQIAL